MFVSSAIRTSPFHHKSNISGLTLCSLADYQDFRGIYSSTTLVAFKMKVAVSSKTFATTYRLHDVTPEDHSPNLTPISNP
jgi:hypothetical protein